MFELDYKIVQSEYDDFIGQHGFFLIKCNENDYGEMYSGELEDIMDKVSLYDWFERLFKVVENLMIKDYVVLSDVESYNTWIEFKKEKDEIIVSVVKATKEQNSHDIEFDLRAPKPGKWINQVISFNQLKNEVLKKGIEYVKTISEANSNNVLIDKMEKNFEELFVVCGGVNRQ